MSRISNLTSIRKKLYNSWQNDWYDKTHYQVLLYQDIKTRLYLSGIFKRLETPTSYFYIKRDNNLNFFLYSDIYLLEKTNISKYRNLFIEFEKINYFNYLNYYTIYSYFFLKLKQYSIPSKINLGFNAEIDFKWNVLNKKNNLLLSSDNSKNIIYSLFYQKKNKLSLLKHRELFFSSFLNNYKEQTLDVAEKFNILFNLNITRDDSYSLVRDWTESWFYHSKNNMCLNRNFLYFFLSFNVNKVVNSFSLYSYLPGYVLFCNTLTRNENYYKNIFYNVFSNSLIKNKMFFISQYNKVNLKTEKNIFALNNLNISSAFIKCPSKTTFFLYKYLHLYSYLFTFFFNSSLFNSYVYNFLHLKNKVSFYFINKKQHFFLSEWSHLKRLFYNHKKFLKRISNFEKLKYRFINRTYHKKYIHNYFYYFVKEIESTISYYFTKKKYNIYNVYIFFSFFEKKENQVPPIKDAKIISDYVMYQLHKFYSLNRIFYEIRDWQFKNYYNKKYISSSRKLTMYNSMYQEKKYPVLGMRIECSGSYKPGSRKNKKYYGEILKDVELISKSPNNSFYADLDYYQVTARLKSGSIGIKVWVFFKTHLYNSNKHYISIVTSN